MRLSASAEVTWKKLIDEDGLLPAISEDTIEDYFVHLREDDGLERQDWKNLGSDGGYKLFKEGHVQDISVATRSDECLIKCKCLPEMKKDRVYAIDLSICKPSNSITGAKCTCPAGRGPSGSCKHIAAACFALEDYVRSSELSCTDVLQKWSQPSRKRRLDPKPVEEISFHCPVFGGKRKKIAVENFDPRPLHLRKTTTTDLLEFKDSLALLPKSSGFLHLLTQAPSLPVMGDHRLPLIPRSVQARIRHEVLKTDLPPTCECIQSYGQQFIDGITPTEDQKENIEEKTRLQGACVRWHQERYCRLTASHFGQVFNRKSGFNKLAADLLSLRTIHNAPAIKWGREHESVAFQEYDKKLSQIHPNLKLRKAGFYVGDPAYLGASPDGILLDETGQVMGIIEIKCPYSAANLTVKEACEQLSTFYCSWNTDSIQLNTSHMYYFQIQGTMALTQAKFCDFVVWTPKSMEISTVNFSSHQWDTLIFPKLSQFYKEYMLPLIVY